MKKFDPVIYPRKVWIALSSEDINDKFDSVSEYYPDLIDAIVDRVTEEESGLRGILIRFRDLDSIDYETVTHESNHAAMEIFRDIDAIVDINNQEPFCYLSGWISKCCQEFKEHE